MWPLLFQQPNDRKLADRQTMSFQKCTTLSIGDNSAPLCPYKSQFPQNYKNQVNIISNMKNNTKTTTVLLLCISDFIVQLHTPTNSKLSTVQSGTSIFSTVPIGAVFANLTLYFRNILHILLHFWTVSFVFLFKT